MFHIASKTLSVSFLALFQAGVLSFQGAALAESHNYTNTHNSSEASTGLLGKLRSSFSHMYDKTAHDITSETPDTLSPELRASLPAKSLLQTEHISGPTDLLSHQNGNVTLERFVETSLLRSDRLRGSLHRVNAARYAKHAAVFSLLPRAQFDAQVARTRNDGTLASVSSIGIQANLTLFASGRNWANIKAANFRKLQQEMQHLSLERQTLVENTFVYAQLYATSQLVRQISKTLSRVNAIRGSVNQQFKAGLVSKLDVALVNAEIAATKQQLEQARGQLEQQRAAYTALVGYNPPSQLKPLKVSHIVPKTLQGALDRALNQNFTLQAALLGTKVASAQSDAVRGEFLPRVELTSEARRTYQGDLNQTDWSVGLQLTVPLGDLNGFSRYREARQLAIAADYDARDTRSGLQQNVERQWLEYQSLTKRRKLLVQQSKSLAAASNVLKRQLAAGVATVDELLRAEIRQTDNAVELVQTDLRQTASALQLISQFSDVRLQDLF